MTCPAIIKSGQRKGQMCGAKVQPGHTYCGTHKNLETGNTSPIRTTPAPTMHSPSGNANPDTSPIRVRTETRRVDENEVDDETYEYGSSAQADENYNTTATASSPQSESRVQPKVGELIQTQNTLILQQAERAAFQSQAVNDTLYLEDLGDGRWAFSVDSGAFDINHITDLEGVLEELKALYSLDEDMIFEMDEEVAEKLAEQLKFFQQLEISRSDEYIWKTAWDHWNDWTNYTTLGDEFQEPTPAMIRERELLLRYIPFGRSISKKSRNSPVRSRVSSPAMIAQPTLARVRNEEEYQLARSRVPIALTDDGHQLRGDESNETFGMTVEAVICRLFNIPIPASLHNRYKFSMITSEIALKILDTLWDTPPVRHIGGSASVDFAVMTGDGEKTLSVKSNTSGDKVCPQTIGQTTKRKFAEYFQISPVNDQTIKRYIMGNLKHVIFEMLDNLNCCNYLLQVKQSGKVELHHGDFTDFKNLIENSELKATQTLESWNESVTLKYVSSSGKEISFAEIQLHTHRDQVKFRFMMCALS